MTKTIKKFKLTYQNILFIAIGLICAFAAFCIVNSSVFYNRIAELPKFIRLFFIRYFPMFGVILSYFLWDAEEKRPTKLYFALFIVLLLKITVYGYFLPFIARLFLTDAYLNYLATLDTLPTKVVFNNIVGNLAIISNEIAQIVIAILILKRMKTGTKQIKFIFYAFIIFNFIYIVEYFYSIVAIPILLFNAKETVEEYNRQKNLQYTHLIIEIPFFLSKLSAVVSSFPLIIHFQGEQSLWYQFKKGPLRKFLKILRPYNPTGVE